VVSDSVRVGIIGAGLWGTNHALALKDHPGCALTVICDRDASRARALAERFGCEWTTSVEAVAASDVEAVTVATPDHLHAEPVLAMLAAGKHVLVEKPIATTVAEAAAMVEAADRAGRTLMVDFHARWHPLYMGAKAYVERGDLGPPVMGYARLSDTIYVPTEMLAWGSQSGPEWFLFPHTMDLVRWLFAREPVEVYAKGTRGVLERRGINCWDTIQALVEFEGGAICTFETSWIVPNSFTNVVDNRVSIYGESGGLEVKNEPSLWAFTDRFHTPFSSSSVTRYGKVWGYQYEPIRYFVDCVARGISPESTGRDGLVVTAMIAATLQSLAERRPVRVADLLDGTTTRVPSREAGTL
jgi:predicted dehydrogenase